MAMADPKNVAGFEKGAGDVFADGDRTAVGDAFKGLEGLVGIGGGVERFHPFQMKRLM
jgi:hypothetical protein